MERWVDLIEQGVLRNQPLDSILTELAIQVLQGSVNAIAVQLIPAVCQDHGLQMHQDWSLQEFVLSVVGFWLQLELIFNLPNKVVRLFGKPTA